MDRLPAADESADEPRTITIERDDAPTMLAGGLNALVGIARGGRAPVVDQATFTAAIRADGADLAGLFIGLTQSLLNQMDNPDVAMGEIFVDGILRTDEGLTAWGQVSLLRPSSGPAPSIDLVGPPVVTETDNRLRLTFRVRTCRSS